MKNMNFYLRAACLFIIFAAILFYNGKKSDDEMTVQIQELTEKVDALEDQQEEILTALQEYYTEREEEKSAAQTAQKEAGQADAEDQDDTEFYYNDGTFTGDGTGFGGNIQVAVTIEKDTLTDISVVSAPGEDSAYLSQAQAVIATVLSLQSTNVDTVSGATFSSTGILNAIDDALAKAEKE